MTLNELTTELINLLQELKNEHPQHRSTPIGVEKFIGDEVSPELLHSAIYQLSNAGLIGLSDGGGSRKNYLAYSTIYLK